MGEGEIKSTLELVMERTRNLVPTREEREEMNRREHEAEALALVRRLLAGELSPGSLQDRLRERAAASPDFPWQETVCRACIRETVPGENEGVLFPVLEALGCQGAGRLADECRRVREQLEEARRAAAERMLGQLRAEGIAGSAVVPNVAGDGLWGSERARLQDEFAQVREEIARAEPSGP